MKIFISYSHEDRKLAGQIKEKLERYGLKLFLAHDDIEPAEEWVEKIHKELQNCHVFLPILTENFNMSYWTDQETGIAYYLEKLILPIKVSADPHGFISRYQALLIRDNDVDQACKKIVERIAFDQSRGRLFKNALIRKFAACDSFNEAAKMTELLISFENYTITQINKIIEATIDNSQIHNCFKCQGWLRYFISNYEKEKEIDSKRLKTFYSYIGK